MKNIHLVFTAFGVSLLCACSAANGPSFVDDGTGTDDDAGSPAPSGNTTADAGAKPPTADAAPQPSVKDSGSSGSTPDAAPPGPACGSPSDCSNGNVCCAVVKLTGGSIPNCTTDTPIVACVPGASCGTKTGMSCSGTQVLRLCNKNSDCTESSNNKCCTFSDNNGSMSFCSNSLTAAFGGGQCM